MKYDCQVLDRFPRNMVLARRAVESGAMGRMGFANVELNRYLPQGYYRQTPLQHRTWRGTWQGEGGGAAFHHGRYIVDPFLSVVGSPAVQVFAYSGPKGASPPVSHPHRSVPYAESAARYRD